MKSACSRRTKSSKATCSTSSKRGPFEADAQAKDAAIKQVEAQLRNADVTLNRAKELLRTTAGTQVTVDAAEASQQALAAQLLAAQAQLRQSQINLYYT